MKNLYVLLTLIFIPLLSYSQTTVTNNNPFTGAFLGWNAGQDLDFKTN